MAAGDGRYSQCGGLCWAKLHGLDQNSNLLFGYCQIPVHLPIIYTIYIMAHFAQDHIRTQNNLSDQEVFRKGAKRPVIPYRFYIFSEASNVLVLQWVLQILI